jgi:hypothetical protein
MFSGTGTDQKVSDPYTGEATVINSSATLTTTWQRFTYTGTVASTATELGLQIFYQAVGTAGAADFFEITGVQVEVGSVATQFTRTGGTIQGELLACQRYARNIAGSTGQYGPMGIGFTTNTTNALIFISLSPEMRTTPTLSSVTSAAANFQLEFAGAQNALTALALQGFATASNKGLYLNATSTGLTGDKVCTLRNNNTASNIVLLDAEL